MKIFKLLKTLSETPGPSGFERRIADQISQIWEPFVDKITTDRVGSVFAVKSGSGTEPRPQLLLAAHMDEIGLMVTEVVNRDAYGFLRVTNVGGVDIRHLYSQPVVVHGRRDIHGVLASLPARMLPSERRNGPFGFEDLVVDPGLPMEILQELVDIGDFISFRQPLRKLMGKNVTGKALDNRASVAAVIICLEELQDRNHEWDIVAAATAQEETRLLGAYTGAFLQEPDAAVAIDVTFAKGAGLSEQGHPELNSGPGLYIGPNVHPGMYKALKSAAEAIEMDVSVGTHTRGSGTDAFGIQVARSGVPTGLVSIPLRYMHTMVETVNTKDVERTGRLLAEFITRLDSAFLTDIVKEMMEEED
jgi:putative aminopeptidase FrvX